MWHRAVHVAHIFLCTYIWIKSQVDNCEIIHLLNVGIYLYLTKGNEEVESFLSTDTLLDYKLTRYDRITPDRVIETLICTAASRKVNSNSF